MKTSKCHTACKWSGANTGTAKWVDHHIAGTQMSDGQAFLGCEPNTLTAAPGCLVTSVVCEKLFELHAFCKTAGVQPAGSRVQQMQMELSNSLGNRTSHLRPLHSPTQLFGLAYRMSQAIQGQTASSRTPEAMALPSQYWR